jgi:hypothetical protein
VNTPPRLRTLVFGLLIVCGHNVAHSQGSDSQRLQDLLTLATSDAASERVDAAKGLGLGAYDRRWSECRSSPEPERQASMRPRGPSERPASYAPQG